HLWKRITAAPDRVAVNSAYVYSVNMNPKSDTFQPPNSDAQSMPATGTPSAAEASSMSQEAANTEMPVTPVAGQKIEPQTASVPAAPAPVSSSAPTSTADASQGT